MPAPVPPVIIMHIRKTFTPLALAALGLLSASSTWSIDTSCQLQYPIVLSHMWSATPICERPEATGKLACENTQDYEKYCAQKSTLADGTRKCLAWRVPDDEADLPPREALERVLGKEQLAAWEAENGDLAALLRSSPFDDDEDDDDGQGGGDDGRARGAAQQAGEGISRDQVRAGLRQERIRRLAESIEKERASIEAYAAPAGGGGPALMSH